MSRHNLMLAAVLGLAGVAGVRGEEVRILPPTIRLEGPRSSHRVLVERWGGNSWVGDATRQAAFAVDNPRVARIDSQGEIRPVGNGFATLTAKVGDQVARATISVEDHDLDVPWSFRNHVQPVLTRQGCNSGACHGAAAGKNGFRLSLRGYATEQDYDALTRQVQGRRIVSTAPAESLMLLKPTGILEHGGGVKFSTDSIDYRVLSGWIADGMPGPSSGDSTIRSISVYPEGVTFAPGAAQQILVQATYSDGHVEDVSRWAKFTSTDETVARVDESGRLTVQGHGEAAVSIWFASTVGRVTVTSPFPTKVAPSAFTSAARLNPIDAKNLAKLEQLRIPPSPDAGDAAYLRRAYLDATGTLPPVEMVESFLKDKDPARRARLVDRLLESQEYVDYWAYRWSDLLLVSSGKLPVSGMWSFYRFVRKAVAENQPWSQFARSLLTSKGSSLSNGAANYFALHRDTIDLAESTSMAFLGLSLTCARCHNHPMEKWTQDDYYGFGSLFSRVQLKDGTKSGETLVTAATEGEIAHPRRGVAMPPRPLDGAAGSPSSRRDRRELLVDWMTSPENPYFARAIVNRVWSNFFGRGLVHPEDDLRLTNPPSDGPLLEWLVGDFVAHGHDVKHLIRTIMSSATYARSSDPVPGNETDARFLSRYPVKRLSAEVLLDAVSGVTGVPTSFPGYPSGWRSMQLPDTKVESRFLDSFGRPVRVNTCSCERSSEPSIAQALHLANGATINEKLRAEAGVITRLISEGTCDGEILDRLYLTALARPPKPHERDRMMSVIREAEASSAKQEPAEKMTARRQVIEDLYWAILTIKEFMFNH